MWTPLVCGRTLTGAVDPGTLTGVAFVAAGGPVPALFSAFTSKEVSVPLTRFFTS